MTSRDKMSGLLRCCRSVGLAWCLASCGSPPPPATPSTPPPSDTGMVTIQAGAFLMGSDKQDTTGLQREFGFVNPLYMDEHPRHSVMLPAFKIDRYEVTNAQYKQFTFATAAREPPQWISNGYNVHDGKLEALTLERLHPVAKDYFKIDADTTMTREALLAAIQRVQQQRDKLPVTGVSWDDAYSYCLWLGKRLPSEAEWEKAARGTQGQDYPWGNEWNEKVANTGINATEEEPLVAVGSYPTDKSPYGVYDLGGNVSEWVADWYKPYPGARYANEAFGEIHKVVKGGGAGQGHYALSSFYRAARRAHAEPGALSTDVGFRCARQ